MEKSGRFFYFGYIWLNKLKPMQTKIFGRLYGFFLLLLPLVFYPGIVDLVLLPRQVYLGIFTLLLTGILWRNKQNLHLIPLRSAIPVAVFSYVILAVLSFFQSAVVAESHAVLSKQQLLFSFFLITTILLCNGFLKIHALIWAVVGFGFVAMLTACFQLLLKAQSGEPLFHAIHAITGGFTNKNLLSSILFLCLPFFFMAWRTNGFGKIVVIGGIGLLLLIISVIRTRSVIIATVLFFMILLYFLLRIRLHFRNRSIVLGGIGVSAIAIGSYLLQFQTQIQSLKSSQNAAEQYFFRLFDSETLQTRSLYWENSCLMFRDHWFLGTGLGNWQILFPKYGLEKFTIHAMVTGESTVTRPHNDYLWMLCETGILGFLAYASIFGVAIWYLIRLIRKSETNRKWRYVYLLAGFFGYSVIAFFDFPMERIEHQILLILILAVVAYSWHSRIGRFQSIQFRNSMLFFLLSFCCLYAITIAGFRIDGETHTKRMYAAKSNQDWDAVNSEAEKAAHYFYSIDPSGTPLVWYRGMAKFTQKDFSESNHYFKKAYKLAPYNIQVINNYGSASEKNGNRERAKELYLEALQISPRFEDARLNLAAVYFNMKNYEKAFETIDKIPSNSENTRYQSYLIPILEKKTNLILLRIPPESATTISKTTQNPQELLHLYFESKDKNITFTEYITNLKSKQ